MSMASPWQWWTIRSKIPAGARWIQIGRVRHSVAAPGSCPVAQYRGTHIHKWRQRRGDRWQSGRCAFGAPLITHQFGCRKAEEVTRRGGPDIARTDGAAAARCEALLARLKVAALPAFGVEDDLLSMPHSVLVKIQPRRPARAAAPAWR
ncbi:MAG: hypothetical protein MZV70_41785 [Desulfobacterales bacterium]|nr:hypothetical protein [Desulfobacterales bacterium]